MGQISLTGQAAALHNLGTNGLIARTGSGTVASRSLSAGGGINVQNSDGVSGDPGIQLSGQAAALNNVSVNGFIYRTAASTFTNAITGSIGIGGIPSFNSVPVAANSTGTPGQIAVNATHFYVCTASNQWGRVQITSW